MAPKVQQLKPKKEAKPPVTFKEATEVASVANRLMDPRGRAIAGVKDLDKAGGVLPHLSHLRQAPILFLFTSAEKVGKHAAAQASRFAKKHLPIAEKEYEFEIVVSEPRWSDYDEGQRNALVYHELLHCGINDKDKYYVVPHDLEEFKAVVRYFGFWDDRTREMYEQMQLFDSAAHVRAVK